MSVRPNLSREIDPGDARPRFGIERSRLGAYAALGASAGAVPIPWIPDALLFRVRGALIHDVAAQHGLFLTPSARRVLSQPSLGVDASPARVAARALGFVSLRLAGRALSRLAPIGILWPVRDAVRTYALGHLLDHYLRTSRKEVRGPLDEPEARRVRAAIDGAAAHIFSVESQFAPSPEPEGDARDAMTALIDRMLTTTASLPERVMRRLEAAFDEAMARP